MYVIGCFRYKIFDLDPSTHTSFESSRKGGSTKILYVTVLLKAAAIVEAIATKIGGRDFLLLAHTAQHTLLTQCFLTTC